MNLKAGIGELAQPSDTEAMTTGVDRREKWHWWFKSICPAPISNDSIGVEGNASLVLAGRISGSNPHQQRNSRNQARHGVTFSNTTRVPRRNVMTVAGGLQHRTATGRADALKRLRAESRMGYARSSAIFS